MLPLFSLSWRANQFVESWTDAAVRRFDREMDHHLQDLLDLSRADITSRRPGKRQQALENIDRLEGRMRKLRAEDAILPLLPSGIGNAKSSTRTSGARGSVTGENVGGKAVRR